MKYRKKPVIIEAIKYTGTEESFEEIDDFAEGRVYIENDKPFIAALEGRLFIEVGDYVVKGVKGEFYSCKPDIFKMTYEEYPLRRKEKNMTNYEKIFSVEEIAKQRTPCVSYSRGYTYLNDAGRFSSDQYGDDVYKIAIAEEIKWLNQEISLKENYCMINYLECCDCQPCCEHRINITKEEAKEKREYIKHINNKSKLKGEIYGKERYV